jgi:hypothetical protein
MKFGNRTSSSENGRDVHSADKQDGIPDLKSAHRLWVPPAQSLLCPNACHYGALNGHNEDPDGTKNSAEDSAKNGSFFRSKIEPPAVGSPLRSQSKMDRYSALYVPKCTVILWHPFSLGNRAGAAIGSP